MTFSKIKRIVNTIKYLKFRQVYYRFYYSIRNRFVRKTYNYSIPKKVNTKGWTNSFTYNESYISPKTFVFLNLKHHFEEEIDWNYHFFGKLWTYNLNYFDFLNQKNITKEQGLFLIHNFINKNHLVVTGFDPYPISLRVINWIKFLITHQVNDALIDSFLYNDFLRLLDNLEYNLLGNHLLENGYSLLFGAYYFEDKRIYNKATEILKQELEEQILDDGAHFELSPMYHKILLTKLLDCIQLIQRDDGVFHETGLKDFLEQKANLMLGFLKNILFKNHIMPLLNDAANGIAPNSKSIFDYAKELNLSASCSTLKGSGYVKKDFDKFEVIVDVGEIGASYQPAHAHADTFNFCMQYDNTSFIVDTGTSTYNIGERRNYERSTIAHNTVSYNNLNSSEVWKGFRVARRAKVIVLKNCHNQLIAEHDGFKREGVLHLREFEFLSNEFKIKDYIKGKIKYKSTSSIHFHPDVKLEKFENHIILNNVLKICWSGFENIIIKEYQYAPKFNILQKALKIEGYFFERSEFKIRKI